MSKTIKLRVKKKVTAKTGELCPQSGDYRCPIHLDQVIPLAKNNKVPPCADGKHGTTWIMIKAR